MGDGADGNAPRVCSVRLVVSGYYGLGNLGDEAVLAGLLSAFEQRAALLRSAFTVLSATPRDTAERHGVGAAARMRLGAVCSALRHADLLLSGGGSLLQDATSVRSLVYYLFIMRLAAAMGKPFAVVAQGIGPLRRATSRTIVRSTLNRALCITVRDAESAALLAKLGVSRPPIQVTADPVFALPPPDVERGRAILAEAGATEGPVIGMALRRWNDGADAAQWGRAAVEALVRDTGATVVLLPMHRPGDLEMAETIAAASQGRAKVIRRALGVEDARSAAAAVEVLVGMRLHALIFAAAASVPVVAVSYDPKVASLMQEIGQADLSIPLAGIDPERLAEAVRLARSEREARARRLATQAGVLAERSLRNVDVVLGALSGRA